MQQLLLLGYPEPLFVKILCSSYYSWVTWSPYLKRYCAAVNTIGLFGARICKDIVQQLLVLLLGYPEPLFVKILCSSYYSWVTRSSSILKGVCLKVSTSVFWFNFKLCEIQSNKKKERNREMQEYGNER